MKIKIKNIRENENPDFLSHLILSSVNNAAIKSLPEDRTGDTEFELILTMNGIEININKFCDFLENAYDEEVKRAAQPEAIKIFEKMKNDFLCKKSANAQLDKFNKSLVKYENHIKQLKESVKILADLETIKKNKE